MDFETPPKKEDGWKLLEEFTNSTRKLVAWYNPNDGNFSLIITHLHDQPNALSKKGHLTKYGYITNLITGMYTCKEAAEVVSLYLTDLQQDNCWWEDR